LSCVFAQFGAHIRSPKKSWQGGGVIVKIADIAGLERSTLGPRRELLIKEKGCQCLLSDSWWHPN
jgi:hypothetical protein